MACWEARTVASSGLSKKLLRLLTATSFWTLVCTMACCFCFWDYCISRNLLPTMNNTTIAMMTTIRK